MVTHVTSRASYMARENDMKLGRLCHTATLHILSTVNDFKRICTRDLTTTAARPAGGVPKGAPAVPDWFLNNTCRTFRQSRGTGYDIKASFSSGRCTLASRHPFIRYPDKGLYGKE